MRKAGLAVLACAAVLWTTPAHAAGTDDATLHRYAGDTWASFVAMTDPASGLPTDQSARRRDDAASRRRRRTSARTCGAPSPPSASGSSPTRELVARLQTTIGDARAHGAPRARRPVLQLVRPPDRREDDDRPRPATRCTPILSSVDNGWLATGLRVVANTVPEVAARARAIYDGDGLRLLLRPGAEPHPLPLRPRPPATGPCCYDTLVSESRIADYIGIAKGELPRKEYYGRWRTFPDTCDFASLGDAARRLRSHLRRRRRLRRHATRTARPGSTPSWGGSMFEALMPALFVPEERWAPGSWGARTTRSPSTPRSTTGSTRPATALGLLARRTSPRAATTTYGVDAIGMNPDGYPSNEDNTLVDRGFPGCPGRAREARPAAERLHERRRHAARRVPRAALRPREAMADLAQLARDPRRCTARGASATRSTSAPARRRRRLPVARPGDDHGRARQRARRRRAPARVRHARPDAGDPAGRRRRGVRRRSRGAARSPARRATTASRARRATT